MVSALLMGGVGWAVQSPPKGTPLVPVAQVKHPPIDEMSGIVKSQRYSNTYWVHNDSGDVPRLFACRADGSLIVPAWLSGSFFGDTPVEGKQAYPGVGVSLAANYDWEDIAIDGDTLYVGDVGNNGNARRDLGVYVIPEPNPAEVGGTRILKWLPVAYPDQQAFPPATWHYDCEALFVVKHKLYFLTKWRTSNQIGVPDVGTSLYRLDTQYTDRTNVLKLVETRNDVGGWVTAASVSPDGKTLAVLCQAPVQSVWLFDISGGGDKFLSRPARRLVFTGAKQCEAICFEDANMLLVTNEQRDIFRLRTAEFSRVTR
ncbi:MAG: hypothetical protein H7145_02155 [Akkermansiaceae bacterium]|nr:hypothetical protein [Armatimonadota bacterium]